MNVDQIRVVERLRAAAAANGDVYELLMALNRTLLIDGNGNKEITAEGDDLQYLEAVLLAASFAAYDLEKEVS